MIYLFLLQVPVLLLISFFAFHFLFKINKVENWNYKKTIKISLIYLLLVVFLSLLFGKLLGNLLGFIGMIIILNKIYKIKFLKSFLIILLFSIVNFLIILFIVAPFRYYLAEPFYVKGSAMEPNFISQDYLIIDKINYQSNNPKRGDIIIHEFSEDPSQYFIKRIVALPGEKIQIKDGTVYLFKGDSQEGEVLVEDYLAKNMKTLSLGDDIISLGDDEYYVLGDNRVSSKDSRSYGPIKKGSIIGKASARLYPFNRFEIFK